MCVFVTVSAVLGRRGELDGEGLKACQDLFAQEPNPERKFMQLQLDPAAHAGQSDDINQVSIMPCMHVVLVITVIV